jgi:sRNA-binding regulator protein Hfq
MGSRTLYKVEVFLLPGMNTLWSTFDFVEVIITIGKTALFFKHSIP